MSAVRSIELSEYDAAWPERFEMLRERLRSAIPAAVTMVEHVGGTAVPGLAARPVIDINVSVADYSRAYELRSSLEAAGFQRSFEGDLPGGQLYFLREDGRVVSQISLTYPGSALWRRDLAFRDRLRTDPAARGEYAELKKRLVEDSAGEKAYLEGKSIFVARLVGAGWKDEVAPGRLFSRRRVVVGSLLALLIAGLAGAYGFLAYTAEYSRGSDGLPDHRPIRAADLWPRTPARLYYPGSAVVSTRGQDGSVDVGAGPARVETTLRTDAPPAALAEWYSRALARMGWTALPADPGAATAGEIDLNWRRGRREYFELRTLAPPIGTALAYETRYEIGTGR